MRARSRIAWVLALTMVVNAGGCRWFRRAPKPPPPAPTQPATAPTPEPPEAKPPPEPELGPPPQLPAGQPQIAPPPRLETPLPKPPRPQRRSRTVRKSTPQPPREPVEEPAKEPPKPVAPLPQLQQILTPEEEREANRVIDQCVSRVERALATFQGRPLTGEQVTSISRIRAFLEQAQQTRKTDLLTARALAERAAVLADDLVRSAP